MSSRVEQPKPGHDQKAYNTRKALHHRNDSLMASCAPEDQNLYLTCKLQPADRHIRDVEGSIDENATKMDRLEGSSAIKEPHENESETATVMIHGEMDDKVYQLNAELSVKVPKIRFGVIDSTFKTQDEVLNQTNQNPLHLSKIHD